MAASSSSIRAFLSVLRNYRLRFCGTNPNFVALRCVGCLEKNSPSSVACKVCVANHGGIASIFGTRRIWTCPPVYMGRRSSKIATRKGAQDAKKAKRYGKIGKEIVSAVKKGGPNPVSNSVLAAVLEKARELDVPKEIVERNIKRASEKGQEAYIEKIYEVYGFGGVSMVVEVLTDKVNRSVAAVREVVKDCGGKMADPGSVMFKFKRARVVTVKPTDVDKDQLLAIALDAGAEDVIEPPAYEDADEEDQSENCYKIVSSAENYAEILDKLRDQEISFEPDGGSELLPLSTIEVMLSLPCLL
ncbi:unnamed protein product [Victoria cruziana]